MRQGSEAEGRAAADAPLLSEDFAAMTELLDRHPGIPRMGFTLSNYMAAASWLASRGFGVDDVHGIATLQHRPAPAYMLLADSAPMPWMVRVCHNPISGGCRLTAPLAEQPDGTVNLEACDHSDDRNALLQATRWCRWLTYSTTKLLS